MKPEFSAARIHAYLHMTGLLLLACALPLSRALLSIAQGLLVVNWLAGGNFTDKFRRMKANPAIVIFASLFLVYVAGLAHSGNTAMALTKIKNILSVLILSLVIGSSPALPRKFTRILLVTFAAAVLLASAISLIHAAMIRDPETGNLVSLSLLMPPVRPSLFMLPIRFSLLVNMAIFILYGLAFRSCCGIAATGEKISYAVTMAALAAFLFVLGSMTGVVTLCLLLIWTLAGEVKRSRSKMLRNATWLVATGSLLVFILYPAVVYRTNFHGREVFAEELDTVTVNGNRYLHDAGTGVMENGHYVDVYVCEKELREAWNGASALSFDDADMKGQQLRFTLRRYMTSKGLRKDSLGFRVLTPEDITAVENGMSNARFLDASPFFQRLYGTLWEVHVYQKTGYVQDHSFAQRIAFSRLGLKLAGKHLLFGTGPGDVQQVMLQEAARNGLLLEEKWEGKPHNQFLFLLLAFGLAGFGWALFSWIYPLVARKENGTYFRDVFLIISLVSMLVMDTLESYDSVVFFAFFYSLFILAGAVEPDPQDPHPGREKA